MASAGDVIGGSRWGSAQFGPPQPQSSVSVTDLSQHVDGGSLSGTTGTNSGASMSDKSLLYTEAGIVLGALGLLWLMGAVVFKSARL